MPGTFRCSIITPTRQVFDEDVAYASFPAWDGQHGVMAGQAPLLSRLGYGALRIDVPGRGRMCYLVESGFAHVTAAGLVVLTDRATPEDELSLEEAEAELAEAVARLEAAGEQRAVVERDQQRALAKRALARAAKPRSGH